MLPIATKSTTMASLTAFKQWVNQTSRATKVISSLVSSGLVATATCTAHGYATNDFVLIAGASVAGYNGSFIIAVVDANTFTYALATALLSPAAGNPTVTPDDARYVSIVNAASAEIEEYLSIKFVTQSVTDQFSGDDKNVHILNNTPVQSISSVTIDGVSVPSSEYIIDDESGILTLTVTYFTGGIKNCIVEYVCGYDVQDGDNLPSDIYRACLDLAKVIRDELVSNVIAATSVSLGPTSMVVKASKVPPSVQRVLDNWEGAAMRP